MFDFIFYAINNERVSETVFHLNRKTLVSLAGAVEYTDCVSAVGQDPYPTNVQDMPLNYLMVRFQ